MALIPTLPEAGTSAPEKAHILVVDDLPEKLLVFGTVLEELDQNLVFVRSGTEALREVLQREFAVILLDVNMPDIDGFETAALIRKYKRSALTPIIFITSYADEMQTTRGYSLGAVDYILSPVVPEVLRSKVKVFVSLYLMQQQMQRQADARAAMMAAQAAREVAEENDKRSGFLADASRALSGSLHVSIAVQQLVRLVVPKLAPLGAVLLADPALGATTVLMGAMTAHAPQAVTWSVSEDRLADTVRAALWGAIRRRRRTSVSGFDLRELNEGAWGDAPEGVLTAGLESAIAVPLLFGERVLGAMLVATRTQSESDGGPGWVVLDDLADRAATALENARLYRTLEGEILERQSAQEELQQSNQRKDEFLAMMSHELRNPLAPIQTAVDLIRRIAPPAPKVSWALEIVDRQLNQMTRLIEELLDVARISQGKIVLKAQSIDLNAVIAQSVETAQPFIDGRGQSLTVSVPARAVWMHGDFARLTQVMSNLLHNASKYSPEGTAIELTSCIDGQHVVVSVRDHGMGIDAELLPRIFDLFAQGERGLDRAQGGLGVGLTLARRLVEMHGGRIEVASEGVDRGSEFSVRLPCIADVAAHTDAVDVLDTAVNSRRLRVMVVDDNRDAALSIAAVLELEGHDVRTSADGAEAIACVDDFRPEVVVLDIGLPLIDGYEVARRLRARPETEFALLIALTGYGQKEDREAAGKAGFDRHFVKPADVSALLDCIRSRFPAAAQEQPTGRATMPA